MPPSDGCQGGWIQLTKVVLSTTLVLTYGTAVTTYECWLDCCWGSSEQCGGSHVGETGVKPTSCSQSDRVTHTSAIRIEPCDQTQPDCDGRSTEGRCAAAGGRVAVGVACVSSRPDFFDGAGGARGERGNGARRPAEARGAGGAPHRSQCPCRMRQSQTVSLLGLVGSRKSKRAEGSSYSV